MLFCCEAPRIFCLHPTSSCIRVSKLVNFSFWVNLWPVFPALCCRCPNLFEMCCLHLIQNKHISTKIHVVDGVKHYIYCLCSVFNWENVKKDKQMITFWLIFVCFYAASNFFWSQGCKILTLFGVHAQIWWMGGYCFDPYWFICLWKKYKSTEGGNIWSLHPAARLFCTAPALQN